MLLWTRWDEFEQHEQSMEKLNGLLTPPTQNYPPMVSNQYQGGHTQGCHTQGGHTQGSHIPGQQGGQQQIGGQQQVGGQQQQWPLSTQDYQSQQMMNYQNANSNWNTGIYFYINIFCIWVNIMETSILSLLNNSLEILTQKTFLQFSRNSEAFLKKYTAGIKNFIHCIIKY